MKRWSTFFIIGLCLTLMSCSAPDSQSTSGNDSPTSSSSTVVVYSPHGPEMGKDYEKLFEAAYPHIDVQWLDMGSQDVYNRISAEQQRPSCDVWWGGPSTMFMKAAQQGFLAPYTPTWASGVGEGFKDTAGHWYGTYNTPIAIIFNTRHYTRNTVPQRWDDLLTPPWNQKIALRFPLPSGTMRTFIGSVMIRQGSDDAGIAWLKQLHAATKAYPKSPQLLFDKIKRNPDLISVWIAPDAVLQREINGYPFDFHIPAQAPVLTEAIAIVAKAPHRENAELFYEFVTTQQALVHQAQTYSKMPTRQDIDSALLPEWMASQSIDALPIDWTLFAEKEQVWIDRWKSEVHDAP